MKTFKVAVYGTLMAGERNEVWGRRALKRIPCTLRGTLYDTGYGFPAFVPSLEGREIRAELLTVPEDGLASMDRLEGYPRLYDRKTVGAVLEDGSETETMVYVMNALPERVRRIDGDDWRVYRKEVYGE